MKKDSAYAYRTLRSKDEGALKALVKNAFSDFLEGDYWDWKYKRNPTFDPSLVAVAEKDGEIVGCNHWLIRDLKFSNKHVIRAVLGADITVSPQHRRQGIGKSLLLFLRSSKAFKEKKAVISYMFPNPELINPLYRPSAFYVPAPNKTASYVKILNWNRLKKRLETINKRIKSDQELREKASKLNMKVLFQIGEAPNLPLKISDEGIKIDETNPKNTHVIFKIDLATLESLKGAKNKTYKLLKAWFTGKLKIKGNFSDMIKLYRNFWIFSEIFS